MPAHETRGMRLGRGAVLRHSGAAIMPQISGIAVEQQVEVRTIERLTMFIPPRISQLRCEPSLFMAPQQCHPSDTWQRAYFSGLALACALSTFFTIFCSSMRNARTILVRTHLPHLAPP
mmetsp:Transcript_26490/g.80363  ORF Transcript_26490/g.80363 Transcript_26490/m.80363 type:complete len:119 (-) Transcript_26490:281-637(-)